MLVESDVHLGNGATGKGRHARLVPRANALRPDLALLPGAFVAGHPRRDAASIGGLVALRALRARLGDVAMRGSNDHWTDAPRVRDMRRRAHVTLLANAAIRRGPIAIGGPGGGVPRHADPAATRAAMRRVGGVPLFPAHALGRAQRLARPSGRGPRPLRADRAADGPGDDAALSVRARP